MNKPFRPIAPMHQPQPAYDDDMYGWATTQAALLRERRVESIDWDNIVEEIEGLARHERSSARSHLRQLMAHILKWDHQPGRRTRSWALSIANQRIEYGDVISENPSLVPQADELRRSAYPQACKLAAVQTGLHVRTFPDTPPSWETLFERPFDFPEP